jgi:two-component system alkaline phosphatase synthesis response regulator PhoP
VAQRILIVDDEADIREFIRYNLTREGYDVHTACNGEEALRIAEQVCPHLILLDMMMPVMDGRQTCEAIRRHPMLKETMVVFLSAVCEERCQVESYSAGADDYITKPVSMRILCSRINAIMKRLAASEEIQPSEAISLNESHHSILTPQGEVVLPRKEFAILHLLHSSPNRIFTREEIFRHVWGEDVVVGDRTLDVHIRRLRRKLGNDRITTQKGVGFAYRAE